MSSQVKLILDKQADWQIDHAVTCCVSRLRRTKTAAPATIPVSVGQFPGAADILTQIAPLNRTGGPCRGLFSGTIVALDLATADDCVGPLCEFHPWAL